MKRQRSRLYIIATMVLEALILAMAVGGLVFALWMWWRFTN